MVGRVIKVENVRVLRSGQLLWIEDGKIVDPQTRFWRLRTEADHAPDEVVDGCGYIVAPGFIDLQLNGGFGFDFSDPAIKKENIEFVAQQLVSTGVTAFCPTLVSSSATVYRSTLPQFPRTNDGHIHGAANMLGVHLEGPFINVERKGAHDESVLDAPIHGIESLKERYGSLENVAMVTLAPELPGAPEAIRSLSDQGIVVSAGHSQANISTAISAVKNGVTMLTHIFNAMGPFHHRDPGLIGLLGLRENRPFYGLILDGVHSHHTSARIVRTCHPHGLVLVTDAMAGMGLPQGEYVLAGQKVLVREGGAYLAGTNIIAGSTVTMDSCIRTLIDYTGCSIVEAIESATLHPARVLGIQNSKGTLNFGSDADFVILDDDLKVRRTYIAGKLVYDAF